MRQALSQLAVVKVGGSLLDHPQFAPTLNQFLNERTESSIILICGGGDLADGIRLYHKQHQLREEASHRLAIETMVVNGHLLQYLVPGAQEIKHPQEVGSFPIAVLNATEFCLNEDKLDDPLPHHWQVTSDSIAARAAGRGGIHHLVMLKSVERPPDLSWSQCGASHLVDPFFYHEVERWRLDVEWVNFRKLCNVANESPHSS